MPPLQPFTIQVEMVPSVHPVVGDELARYVISSVENDVLGPLVGDYDGAIHHAIDKAIKVFGLVKAFRSDSDENADGIQADSDRNEEPPLAHLIQFPSGKLYRCLRDAQAHLHPMGPCERCVHEPVDRVSAPLADRHTAIRPGCWCFGNTGLGPHLMGGPQHPHDPREGCPLTAVTKHDRERVTADIVANVACHCPAYGDMHPWDPSGHCPPAAPVVGEETPTPEPWCHNWYGLLERELASVLNRRNVDGALDRPDWEIARRLMVEVAKMRREARR